MKKIAYMMIAGLVACAVQASLINEGFESYSTGVWAAGVNGWTLVNATNAQQAIIVSGSNSVFGATGSKSLYYEDLGTGIGDLRVRNTLASSVSAATDISFDFKMVGASALNTTFFLKDGAGTTGIQLNLRSILGKVQNFGATMADVSSYAILKDKWYHFELSVADMGTASDTYNLRVLVENGGTGTEVINVSNLAFKTNIADFKMIEFATNTGTAGSNIGVLFDNVQVIPEPATFGLLGFGTLGILFLRRWIRR